MNHVETTRFSNPEAEAQYRQGWPVKYAGLMQYKAGYQCGGCPLYVDAHFNTEWGFFCSADLLHQPETVLERFTCGKRVEMGWGAHGFIAGRPARCQRASAACTKKGKLQL